MDLGQPELLLLFRISRAHLKDRVEHGLHFGVADLAPKDQALGDRLGLLPTISVLINHNS